MKSRKTGALRHSFAAFYICLQQMFVVAITRNMRELLNDERATRRWPLIDFLPG